ncbi:MAG: hypothetical protein H6965_11660 [Chromatiaceae bacterium]|nr:hypothetical protein [Chromatiaceae bacterium]
MHIDRYAFGRITIDGREFQSDLIIFPERIQENWRRLTGHRLDQCDLQTVLTEQPDMLVVGTGFFGRMRVPEETLEHLRRNGMAIRLAKTGAAVAEFNRLQQESARIVAALHLTC